MFLIANATVEIRNIYVPQNLDGSFKGKVKNYHLIVLWAHSVLKHSLFITVQKVTN